MKKYIVIILILLANNLLFAQQIYTTNDFGFWAGVNLKKKVSKDFELNLENQIRYYDQASSFDDYLIELGGKYRLNKNFRFGGNLRYTYNAKRRSPAENSYRYNLDVLFNGKISSKLSIHYRLRYQREYVNLFKDYQSPQDDFTIIRNKIKLRYKTSKSNHIYTSVELFKLIETFRAPNFRLVRFYLGDKFDTKIGTFNCALSYNQSVNTTYPLSFFFLKTIYIIQLWDGSGT